jgi:hypothetical protein
MNGQFAKLWTEAGYPPKMGSKSVVPPPPKPYRRVYYLTSAEYALSNIVFGRIKVARLLELNDPFELLALSTTNRALRPEIARLRSEFHKKNGLLCFSENWTDPVLWSHYASKHRGICLGLNVKKDILRDIAYTPTRILKALEDKSLDEDLAQTILCTKFESWRYEKEKRVIVPLKNATKEGTTYFVEFDDEMQLAEVILGPLCDFDVGATRQAVGKHQDGVTTFGTRLAHKTYDVVPQEDTVPLIRSSS